MSERPPELIEVQQKKIESLKDLVSRQGVRIADLTQELAEANELLQSVQDMATKNKMCGMCCGIRLAIGEQEGS